MLTKKSVRQWLSALKSGEYEQRQASLHYRNTYCCLGVLCKLNNIPMKQITSVDGNTNKDAYHWIANKLRSIGFTDLGILSGKNDDGWSFKEIADFIEEKVFSKKRRKK